MYKVVKFVLTLTNGDIEYIHCVNYNQLPTYRKLINERPDVLEYDEIVLEA